MIIGDINDDDPTLHLPRILCLHGGGTNARIFRAQCRVLKQHLSTTFRLVFAEAPYPSQAGSDVISVYESWGPFKSWLIPPEDNQYVEPDSATEAIKDCLNVAIQDDNQYGATGEWVGLLGFSQGAKICASLLFCQQARKERLGLISTGLNWRFAVIIAGRGPLVALDRNLGRIPGLVNASHTTMTALPDEKLSESTEHILYLPTIHIHGTRDPGISEHRKLLTQYCENGTARLVEWDGDHRVPIKTKDVLALVQQIWDVAYETGQASQYSSLSRKLN